eukprot:8770579-Pyramimonas_sp.AAC.1
MPDPTGLAWAPPPCRRRGCPPHRRTRRAPGGSRWLLEDRCSRPGRRCPPLDLRLPLRVLQ